MQLSPHVFEHKSAGGINVIRVDNALASAEISLFGGHVLGFVPKHDPRQRLWLSPNAVMDGSKAIRGGIPICWPWFGQAQTPGLPAHGYLRQQQWQVVNVVDDEHHTLVTLSPTTTQGQGFSGTASVLLDVLVGQRLTISLVTTNQGQQPFSFCAALHSYFAVQDVSAVRLTGLEGDYLDKTQGFKACPTPAPYVIRGEVDRVHLCPAPEVDLHEADIVTKVSSQGHDSVVVWNPGAEKSRDIVDMQPQGYLQMLCVETAITRGVTLQPGAQHRLMQTID